VDPAGAEAILQNFSDQREAVAAEAPLLQGDEAVAGPDCVPAEGFRALQDGQDVRVPDVEPLNAHSAQGSPKRPWRLANVRRAASYKMREQRSLKFKSTPASR